MKSGLNMKIKTMILLSVFALMFFGNLSMAQKKKLDTPLKPEDYGAQFDLGIVIGQGSNFQSGKFFVDCPDCVFETGQKYGFSLGGVALIDLSKTFRFGIMGLYESLGINDSFRETELVNVALDDERIEKLNVNFRHEAKVDLSAFTITPFVSWNPLPFFFVRTGLSGSFLINSNLYHKKTLTDRFVSIGDIDSVRIELETGGYEKVVEDGDIQKLNPFQLYLVPMAGFTLPFGQRIYFSPYFSYSIPLTDISDNGDAFKINHFRFVLELKMVFNPYRFGVDKK